MADRDEKEPLRNARNLWGHGDAESPALAAYRAKRPELIQWARSMVALAFHRDSALPFRASWLER